MAQKKKKSIAERLYGPKNPDFKRPAPTKVGRSQMAPHAYTLSNGQPRPKKRTGRTR